MAAALCAVLVGAAPASAAELRQPASQTEPPRFFERSAEQVIGLAERGDKVVAEERRGGRLDPTAYIKGPGRWQVSFFRDGEQLVQVQVDDRSGALLEQWTGDQVAWTMARGYEGAFGRKLNAPYVWLPLCLLFLAPFVNLRRPFRLLHLDLLVLLAFGVSHVYFNRGEIETSVPLVYPVLVYLLLRTLSPGLRPRERAGPLVPHRPREGCSWSGSCSCSRSGSRLNVVDSNVIDVGYAGVIGADRDRGRRPALRRGLLRDVERGDTYGPLTYLAYVPFEQALPWSGRWDDLPAAHGAAISFDLLVVGGLLLLGRAAAARPRGPDARAGAGLRVGRLPVHGLLARDELERLAGGAGLRGRRCSRSPSPARARPRRWRAAPPWGRGGGEVRPARARPAVRHRPGAAARRGSVLFALGAAGACWRSRCSRSCPTAALRELYDRTVGYQAGRPSPFSIWGQDADRVAAHAGEGGGGGARAGGGVRAARERGPRQVAALGAAVLIAPPAGRHPLVLPLRGLVRALRARRRADRVPERTPEPAPEPAREREVVLA